MKSTQLSPQERSNLARKAAHARWSRVDVGQAGVGQSAVLSRAVSLPSPAGHCEAHSAEAISFSQPLTAKRKKRSSNHSWLSTRFCLQLYQNPAGEWRLLTPAGIDLPATNAEISLWLDLESLRFQLSSYENIITE